MTREEHRADFDRANKHGWDHAMSDEAKRIQAANPGMTFEAAWRKASREHPQLLQLNASGAFQKTEVVIHAQELTRDPRIHQEMAKHAKLEERAANPHRLTIMSSGWQKSGS